MKKAIGLFGLSVSILLAGCSASAGDQADEQIGEQDGDRVVATTVALTEIMDALEIDLVGVPSSYKELPERYADAKEVGNPMSSGHGNASVVEADGDFFGDNVEI